jgi:hypothetical protein
VAANEAARFTAVVVLPTPPFWFATAMMRFMVGRSYPLAGGFPARISARAPTCLTRSAVT